MIAFPPPFPLWPYPALFSCHYLKLSCLFTCLAVPASSPECKLHEEETFSVLLTTRPGEEYLAHNSCSRKLWVRKEWVKSPSWWGQTWCLADTSQSAMLHTLTHGACLTWKSPQSCMCVGDRQPRHPTSNHHPTTTTTITTSGEPFPVLFSAFPPPLSASSMQFCLWEFLTGSFYSPLSYCSFL